MDIQELAALLRQNGVVGAGGAGFPTYAKLDARAQTIILNCAECEPLLKLHRQLLEFHADEIVAAFSLIRETLGAADAVIGIKRAYKKTIAALEGVLPRYHRQGVGRTLFQALCAEARRRGYEFLQVKTVQEGCYPEYDRTNAFYRSLGFRELECFPNLWDAWNPCQVLVMALR